MRSALSRLERLEAAVTFGGGLLIVDEVRPDGGGPVRYKLPGGEIVNRQQLDVYMHRHGYGFLLIDDLGGIDINDIY